MIRRAAKADLPALKQIAKSTGMFRPDELTHFASEMEAHFEDPEAGQIAGAAFLVAEREGSGVAGGPVCGAACFAPEAMGERVMNLVFLGVAPSARGTGLGKALVAAFEDAARAHGTRLAVIETASDPVFAPARALYETSGYRAAARIPDFYADGLDKVVFTKRLA